MWATRVQELSAFLNRGVTPKRQGPQEQQAQMLPARQAECRLANWWSQQNPRNLGGQELKAYATLKKRWEDIAKPPPATRPAKIGGPPTESRRVRACLDFWCSSRYLRDQRGKHRSDALTHVRQIHFWTFPQALQ